MMIHLKKTTTIGWVFFILSHEPNTSKAVTPELWWEPPIKGATAFDTALGDVNGDGFPDAAWVHLQDEGRILLNDGNGTFTAHPTASPLPPAAAVAMGDLNGDGHLDLLLGPTFSPAQIWTNDGTGAFFNSGLTVGAGVQRRSVALADLNGNGYLDAILPSESTTAPSDIWTNNGAGLFFYSQSLGSNANRNVAIGDLNGNGFPDVVFAANFDNTVWTNDGTGLFYSTGGTAGSGSTYRIALGDLNNDGSLDAFVANGLGQPNEVWFNNGLGIFTNSGQALGTSFSFSSVLVDVDGDADLDALVGNASGEKNSVWLNNGSGIFTLGAFDLGSANGIDLEAADLDGDHEIDYWLTVNANPSEVWLRVPFAQGGPLKDSGQRIGGHQLLEVVPGDFNGDGALDIAFGAGGQVAGILTNHGFGQFSPAPQKLFQAANIGAIETFDVNQDGSLDLVVGLDQSQSSNMFNRIWLNDGTGQFSPGPFLPVGRATTALAVADLDGNGRLDIVEGNRPTVPLPSENPTNHIHFNMGGGVLTSIDALGGGWTTALAVGDLNGDGRPDIVVGNKDIPSSVWTNTGTTQFVHTAQDFPSNVQDVVLADFNNNGALDLFFVASPRSVLYTNNGSGFFSVLSSNFFTTAFTMTAAPVDLNADGWMDVWLGYGSVGAVPDQYAINVGSNNFLLGFAQVSGGANNTEGLAVGDFTGDSRLSVFSAGRRGDSQVWVGAALLGAVEQYAGSFGLLGPDRLPYADYDNDGLPNILEYAYNLNPSVADAQIITNLSTATNGLPFIHVVLSNGVPWFVAETIRLVNPVEVSYHLDVAPSLVFTGSVNAAVSTTPLNADYERATYQAPSPIGAEEAFGRFRVEPEP